ncbi:maleylpyruvate isomerase family mycothiol-dependent enzyme [Streptomyces sp. NPDC050504]|uniref:maleylpyruvate isomerase family mycothiol-dependent enzyme n=1 Tax=Streptomyces sp. NPDC050504 TaxID=3365618 RepID=UPI003797AF84
MSLLSYERHRAEIVEQTELVRAAVEGVDLAVPVATCPGWTLGALLRHIAGAHSWVETIVRTRAQEQVPEDVVNDVAGDDGVAASEVAARLVDGARRLADALGDAGPHAPVWTVAPGGTPEFWARRMAHETAVHRYDVARAVSAARGVDAGYEIAPDLAADAFDEWMGFGTLPQVLEPEPGVPTLLGPGRTLCFRATDGAPGRPADWTVDLTGPAVTWEHFAREDAAVAVRGPVTGLVLMLYGRRSAAHPIEVTGDESLLKEWLARTGGWLNE